MAIWLIHVKQPEAHFSLTLLSRSLDWLERDQLHHAPDIPARSGGRAPSRHWTSWTPFPWGWSSLACYSNSLTYQRPFSFIQPTPSKADHIVHCWEQTCLLMRPSKYFTDSAHGSWVDMLAKSGQLWLREHNICLEKMNSWGEMVYFGCWQNLSVLYLHPLLECI